MLCHSVGAHTSGQFIFSCIFSTFSFQIVDLLSGVCVEDHDGGTDVEKPSDFTKIKTKLVSMCIHGHCKSVKVKTRTNFKCCKVKATYSLEPFFVQSSRTACLKPLHQNTSCPMHISSFTIALHVENATNQAKQARK